MADEDHIPKSIAIIDDDELMRNLVSNYAEILGIENIQSFTTAEEFWTDLEKDTKYDMIVLDWKLPGLNGVGLFNRLRLRKEYKLIPILVISGFLNRADFALLEEFPCTTLLEKPFTKVLLENNLIGLAKEKKWYDEKSELMKELMDQFKDDGSSVVKNLKKVFSESPKPVPLAIIAAKQLRRRGFFKEAKAILEMVVKHDYESIVAMSELGKVLFQMGKTAEAREVLRYTNKVSPENLKRLCLLGEVELNLMEPESARKYFENALDIDPEDKVAISGSVIAENVENHIVQYSKNSIPENFASLLNIIGVTKIRSGSFQEGVDQYKAALSFLTADEVVAKVLFNLGLGFLRWNKPELALPWFIKSAEVGKEFFSKSAYYINRISSNGYQVDANYVDSSQLVNGIDDESISEAMVIAESGLDDSSEITKSDDSLGEMEDLDLGELEECFDDGVDIDGAKAG